MKPQVVVISGGSKGMGQSLAEDVLARGGIVATFSRSPSDFTEHWRKADAARERFLWKAVDGNDFEAARAFVLEAYRHFGRIDALVNNAVALTEQLLTLTRQEDIHRMVAVNLELAILLAQVCAKVMITQGTGVILNVSSLNAIRGHSGVAVYSATKAGLDGLTRSLARELGPRGIRVNSIVPGYFDSPGSRALLQGAALDGIRRRTPLRRLGETSDVVNLARFLLSAEADFITGQSIAVDGGITC
jgi:3-oxoacyl-[acyl-carrier protein] reductase